MFLGIDCGTQGTKSIVVDEHGKRLGKGYALIERPSGAREQDSQWWIDATVVSVHQALAEAPDGLAQALGVSGQQYGLVVLDEEMNVIRPAKLWNDTETAPQNLALIERFGGSAAFLRKFGIVSLSRVIRHQSYCGSKRMNNRLRSDVGEFGTDHHRHRLADSPPNATV
jgi:xylulokinase